MKPKIPKAQPTPGPWEVDKGGFCLEISSGSYLPIAWICDSACGTAEANARLIASAPDLLEVCKTALGQMYEDGAEDDDYLIAMLKAAIAKATT